jgi:hypothetical protein
MYDILRNANRDPLDLRQLKQFSPAIFAKHPHEAVTERYGFIPTLAVVQRMQKEGFFPVEARNFYRRDESLRPYAKHMLRFRPKGTVVKDVGDLFPEIVLVNSHDRTSLYNLYGGLFRLICTNGMVVADSELVEPIKVRHTIRAAEDVVEESYSLAKQQGAVIGHVKEMQKRVLTPKEAMAFARTALERIRSGRSAVPSETSVLYARRTSDAGNDLWHVYQRVQENLTKGGLTAHTADGRRFLTQPISSIDSDLKLNVELWGLAMDVLHKAAGKGKREAVTIDA